MKHPHSYDSTPATRRRMSRVRLKRGKAETALAKALWRQGYRYRLNDKKLPGSPDIALTKYRIAIFVDGAFWHGYDWIHRRERLKANRAYWLEKIEENIARDERNDRLLGNEGWIVLHFWEQEVLRDLDGCVEAVQDCVIEAICRRGDDTDEQPFDWTEG